MMASVLFSTVGQAIGGPLGVGIGAALGANVDRTLFRGARRGAADGFASRSAYGEIVPQVFGRTRVVGLLIWATAPGNSGSKGQGRRAKSTGFAMALSRAPIAEIGRIWADGNLLRNADGDFLTDCVMRVHCAGDMTADPLVVAAEGPDGAPSYAHLSYVVFENFDLGPYGNRIPSLSFEVVAGGGTTGEWLGSLTASLGPIVEVTSDLEAVDGFAAGMEPVSADVADLLAAAGCVMGVREGRLAIIQEPRVRAVASGDLADERADAANDPSVSQETRPSGLSLSYQDSGRDYQLGWQSEVRRPRGPAVTMSWALAASASAARAIAARLLREADAGVETVRITLSHRFLPLSVGDAVGLDDGTIWLVVRREIRGLLVSLEGRRLPVRMSRLPVATDAGRILGAPDRPAPPSIVQLIEPPVPLQGTSGAALLVAVSGQEGWQGADVRLLQGSDELEIGRADEQLPFGVLASDVDTAPETLWDERNHLLVDVSSGFGLFPSRSAEDVLNGGGLVAAGSELIQYRQASPVDPGLVRLSGLLRGRFGTGARGLPAGTSVIAVARTGSPMLDITSDMVGRTLNLLAWGPGDPGGGSPFPHVVRGDGLAPLAPVHLRGRRLADGTVCCSWIDRRRVDWRFEADGGPTAGAGSVPHIWHFRSASGFQVSIGGQVSDVRLDPSDQQAAFGGPMPPGAFRVEAVGDGPDSIRFSRWLAI